MVSSSNRLIMVPYLLCCAERCEAPLLSLDRELLAAAKEMGLAVVEVG
jgi:hypothetical protein